MRLYFAPGACSLADHISLEEAGLAYTRVRVDLQSHVTEDGMNYLDINPKGYVPALALDSGEVLTENVAILTWIADQTPALGAPSGAISHYRLLEMLGFISTEIHKSFKPFFAQGTEEAKQAAGKAIGNRFDYLSQRMKSEFLFGPQFSVADAYLFVMLTWAQKVGLHILAPLQAYVERIAQRPAVKRVLAAEENASPKPQAKAS